MKENFLLELYQSLHRQPELSFEEHSTQRTICAMLKQLSIECRPVAGTGIMAVVKGTAAQDDRRAVVLRADIDALPIEERSDCDCRSQNVGVMHACGHDLHSTVLVGVLDALNRSKESFAGTIIGIFQPAEELNPGGAQRILNEHLFDNYDIKAVIGEHCEPALPTGSFGFRRGKYMASSDELRFMVMGKGGHAALRKELRDPILPAAQLIEELYRIADRAEDKSVPTIVSIGRIEASGATNVVPDTVCMEGTMRTFDEKWREQIQQTINTLAQSIGQQSGVEIEVDISHGYPSVVNDTTLTELAATTAEELFGRESVNWLDVRPTSDDFGRYCAHYPALYYRLGVGYTDCEFESSKAGRLHTDRFMPDTAAIEAGVRMMSQTAKTILNR